MRNAIGNLPFRPIKYIIAASVTELLPLICTCLMLQVVDDILDCTSTSEVLGKTAGKDLATDKTTYPSLLGLERSKEVADELINAAHEALSSYDPHKAAPLRSLAEYVRSRKN